MHPKTITKIDEIGLAIEVTQEGSKISHLPQPRRRIHKTLILS